MLYLLRLAAVVPLVLAAPAFAQQAGFDLSATNGGQEAGAATEAAEPAILKPIAADSRDLFFSGESGFREFAFYALPEETAGDIKLVLTLQSAISNTPEHSQMRVFVNDVELGTVPLASGEPRRVELSVAPGVIQPGFNAVTFLVNQFHRVDCSIDATYELWTQIDPQASGFLYPSHAETYADIGDLAAIARTDAGRTTITAIRPHGASASTTDLLMQAVQGISIAGGFDHPVVKFSDKPGEGPGIDLAVGSLDTIREIFPNENLRPTGGAGVLVAGSPESDRLRIIVSGSTPEQIAATIAALAPTAETRRGTPSGLRALGKLTGKELLPGNRIGLSELGIDMRSFTGRFFQQSVNFEMPNDFYPGDYGKAAIRLNALYAAGLSPSADLLIKLNDVTVSNIGLGAGRNGVIDEQQLPIPFSAFRPGENTLSIEARLPSPADEACDPTRVAGGAGRLQIMPNSYLEIPQFARIGRYPDLASMDAALGQFADRADAKPLTVIASSSDSAALDAAATYLAKVAYSTGRVFPVNLTGSVPVEQDGPVVAFGTYNSLPFDFLRQMNVDFSLVPNVSDLSQTAASSPFGPGGMNAAANAPRPALIERAKRFALSHWYSVRDVARDFGDDVTDTGWRLASMVGLADKGAAYGGREAPYAPPRDTNVVMMQRYSPAGDATWTLIASPGDDQLESGIETLTHRAVWGRLGGGIVAVADTGEILQTVKARNSTLFRTQPVNLGNSRLVVAGWLSNNSDRYAIAILLAFGIIGLFTHLLLRSQRKTDR